RRSSDLHPRSTPRPVAAPPAHGPRPDSSRPTRRRPSEFGPFLEVSRQPLLRHLLFEGPVQLRALAGEATSIQAVQLLAHRLLDRATPIRKPPLFDELVDALQQLFLNCDRNFRGAHWPNPRWYDLFSYQGPCHMTTALGPHAPRRPAPGPEAGGRRHRAPQPRAPDAGSGEAEQTPRPWSRNGICYAVRGGASAPPHAGKTLKPSPRPFERTRSSVLRMRRSGSACRRRRALARCSASSVRTGSTGNDPSALGDLPRQLENRPTGPGLGEDLQHGGAAHLVEQLLGD